MAKVHFTPHVHFGRDMWVKWTTFDKKWYIVHIFDSGLNVSGIFENIHGLYFLKLSAKLYNTISRDENNEMSKWSILPKQAYIHVEFW